MRADGRDVWQKVWTKARELAEAAWDETVRISKRSTLRLEVVQLSRRRRDRCQRLGEKLYELLAMGEPLSPEPFKEDRGFIAELDEEIAEKKAQIERLRNSAGKRAHFSEGERMSEVKEGGEGSPGASS